MRQMSLLNAVVHRDYTNHGRDIKIGIYDDMLNIVSPGAFPSTITQEDILEGRSEIRNRVIARVFKELNYVEQWGSGIRRIKLSCKARGLKEPEILEKGDFVDVSLYRENVEQNKDVLILTEQNGAKSGTLNGTLSGTLNGTLNEAEEKIIVEMRKNPNNTVGDIAAKLGIPVRTVKRYISKLQEKGVLIRMGSRKTGYWEVKE